MVPILIGLGLVGFGVYLHRTKRVPADALVVCGSVIDVVPRRSSIRRKQTLYGPVIAFDHPVTGKHEELHPTSFRPRKPELGESIEVAYSPATGRVLRVPERWREDLVVAGVGIVLIALQIVDWVL